MKLSEAPLRLSEAIRLGSMLRPQTTHGYLLTYDGHTCAWGAAFDAIGVKMSIEQTRRTWQRTPIEWRDLSRIQLRCPIDNCLLRKPRKVGLLIEHLNDYHELKREQIADWIEQVERENEAPRSEQHITNVEMTT